MIKMVEVSYWFLVFALSVRLVADVLLQIDSGWIVSDMGLLAVVLFARIKE